jgi:hypothetical protein
MSRRIVMLKRTLITDAKVADRGEFRVKSRRPRRLFTEIGAAVQQGI